jgi:hypothetical protein
MRSLCSRLKFYLTLHSRVPVDLDMSKAIPDLRTCIQRTIGANFSRHQAVLGANFSPWDIRKSSIPHGPKVVKACRFFLVSSVGLWWGAEEAAHQTQTQVQLKRALP